MLLLNAFRFSALLCIVPTMGKWFKAQGIPWPREPSQSVVDKLETGNHALTRNELKDVLPRGQDFYAKKEICQWSENLLREFLNDNSEFMVDHCNLCGNGSRQPATVLSSLWAKSAASKDVGYGAIRYCDSESKLKLTWSPIVGSDHEVDVKCYRLTNPTGRRVPVYHYRDHKDNGWYGSFLSDSNKYTLAWYQQLSEENAPKATFQNRLDIWELATWPEKWTEEAPTRAEGYVRIVEPERAGSDRDITPSPLHLAAAAGSPSRTPSPPADSPRAKQQQQKLRGYRERDTQSYSASLRSRVARPTVLICNEN